MRQDYGSNSNTAGNEESQINVRATEKGNFWGMILVTGFLGFWTISAAIISWQKQGSTLQWTASRYIIMLFYCTFSWIINKPNTHRLFYGDNLQDRIKIFIHSILENVWVFTYFYALHTVYIGDIESIFLFIAPTIIATIGKCCFNESFPKHIIFIIIIDIIGVIFVTQPSFIFVNDEKQISLTGFTLIFISTIFYSIDIIIVGHNEHIHWMQFQITTSIVNLWIFFPLIWGINNFWFTQSNVIIGGPFDVSLGMLGLNVIIGIVNVLSQMCLIYGYQMGASTKVVWLEYVNLIFAYSIQWILFREIRNYYEIIGALMIASTFFVQFIDQYQRYNQEKMENNNDDEKPMEDTHLLK